MEGPKVELVFSNVHKLKSLERDTVSLLDDFNYLEIRWQASTVEDRSEVQWWGGGDMPVSMH